MSRALVASALGGGSVSSRTLFPVAQTGDFWSNIYTPQSFARDQIEVRDGKLYAGDVEVNPLDRITWSDKQYLTDENGDPLRDENGDPRQRIDEGGRPVGQDYSRAAWAMSDVEGNPYANVTDEQKLRYFFDSGYGDMFYGQNYGEYYGGDAGEGQFNLSSWDGTQLSPYGRNGRGDMTTNKVAIVKQTLRQLYPNKTQEELDQAAYRAFFDPISRGHISSNVNGAAISDAYTNMTDEQHRALGAGEVGYPYYYGYTPNATVRVIADQLGGLTPEQSNTLNEIDQGQLPAWINGRSNIHASEEESGFGDFFSVVAPIALSFLAPGIGNLLSGAAWGAASTMGSLALGGAVTGGLSAAITGGDIGRGILTGGIGGAIGGFTSGLEGGANFMGPVNPASQIGSTTWQQLAGSATRGLVTGAIRGDAGTGLIGGMVGGGMNAILPGSGILESAGRSLATGAITNAITGDRDQSVDAAASVVGPGSSSGRSTASGPSETQVFTGRKAVAASMRAY